MRWCGCWPTKPVPAPVGPHAHDPDFQLLFVLQGWCHVEYRDADAVRLIPGDAVYQPSGCVHDLLHRSEDCEVLEISSPASYATVRI